MDSILRLLFDLCKHICMVLYDKTTMSQSSKQIFDAISKYTILIVLGRNIPT